MNTGGTKKTVTISLGDVGRAAPARNAPCHCGSGKKFKKCHYLIDHMTSEARRAEKDARIAAEVAAERAAREERRRTYGAGEDGVRHRRSALMPLIAMAMAGMPGR